MKTLFLSIVLLGLVAALQAQDPLSFPSEELNVRLGGPVGRDGGNALTLSVGSSWEPVAVVTEGQLTLRPCPGAVRDGIPCAGRRQGPSWGQG